MQGKSLAYFNLCCNFTTTLSHKIRIEVGKMSKLNKKVTIITNLILVAVFVAVLAVTFIPENIVPSYGGSTVSAIYNGNRQNKKVSLMFNVYENSQIVSEIVGVLDKNDAKATFFVGGCWADDNKQTLDLILESGHEIGNHGYFHKDHKKLNYNENRQEIELTATIVQALSGAKTNLFAPPSGSFSELTLESAYDLGHKVIMWSKDTIDWRDKDQALIYNRATENIENGDFILMHPKAHTLSALPSILEFYKTSGFSVVTVQDNLL